VAAQTQAPERTLRLLSVVAPVYNEQETLEPFVQRVIDALPEIEFELVLVDDGSTDDSPAMLDRLESDEARVRVVTLSRNFGHQAALTAGLDHARGDPVLMIDADLQDPPELIPEMIEAWRAGSDVVYAVRRSRTGDPRLKLWAARWFYRLFERMSAIDLGHNSGDFRLVGGPALEALRSMRERGRFIRGMSVWVGFTRTAIPYDRDPRFAGETKYTPRRMLRFSLDAITSFSHVPLQFATLMGFVFSGLAFLAIPVAIGLKIAGQFVPGITTVLLAVLLLGGIQLVTVGIIGEYLGRVYEEVKGRPLYVVRDRGLPVTEGIEERDARTERERAASR
jgi:glycosyltransferase involved in cell wall biosynthesis